MARGIENIKGKGETKYCEFGASERHTAGRRIARKVLNALLESAAGIRC
ncbi:hypothetical protein [Paraburkholderia sp. BL6665CI2N2]|nr:hypothetical protein [Paraburkholderia sp. BL6665CI2N2]